MVGFGTLILFCIVGLIYGVVKAIMHKCRQQPASAQENNEQNEQAPVAAAIALPDADMKWKIASEEMY
jgi:hypothetical protein